MFDALVISPNGHTRTKLRRMRGRGFVLDCVRSAFEWARDPERGGLLPATFRNPFRGLSRRLRRETGTPLHEPDITTAMAMDFVNACDAYQLRIYTPVILYGLRPGELLFLFREYVNDRFLRVPCNEALQYLTKGKRTKELPLIDPVGAILISSSDDRRRGLLYQKREAMRDGYSAPVWSASLDALVTEFERRCVKAGSIGSSQRLRLRDQIMKEAGALTYDDIDKPFRRIARALNWPKKATLKDFRHLFSTTMENAGMPEFYRRYLMGHSPGRSAIVNYTHLNKLPEQYEEAVRREWRDLVDALWARAKELELVSLPKPDTENQCKVRVVK